MKVEKLNPFPGQKTQFAWPNQVAVPELPGCYTLTTYSGDVLYVGLASRSIRYRMGKHLDTAEKRAGTVVGVPFWFHFLVLADARVAPVERGWMNQAILEDGGMPPLNKIYSPI